MKCKPGITTRAFCLNCRADGHITGFNSPMVSMKCPKCGKEWRTLSAICERCKTPSGSPYISNCAKCSEEEVREWERSKGS